MSLERLYNKYKYYQIQNQSKESIFSQLLNEGYSLDEVLTTSKQIEQEFLEESKTAQNRFNLVNLLSTVGILTLSVGLITLIIANWSTLNLEIKLFISLSSFAFINSLGWWLRFKMNKLRVGNLLLIFGSIIYFLNIFLIEKIYGFPILNQGLALWLGYLGLVLVGHLGQILILKYLSLGVLITSLPYTYSYIINSGYGELFEIVFLILAFLVFLVSSFLSVDSLSEFPKIKNLLHQRDQILGQDNFLRQIFSFFSLLFWNIFCWKLFELVFATNISLEIINTWYFELWLFLAIISSLFISLYLKSYLTLTSFFVYFTIFLVNQINIWSTSSFYLFLPQNSDLESRVRPLIGFFLFSFFAVLALAQANTWKRHESTFRLANCLRFLLIIFCFLSLGILSTLSTSIDEFANQLKDLPIYRSWPLMLLFMGMIGIFFAQYFSPNSDFKKWQYWGLFSPILINLLFFSLMPALEIDKLYFFYWIWLISLNFLFLLFPIYLIFRANENGEKWLKILASILLVVAVTIKLFDLNLSYINQGLFFIFLGLCVLSLVWLIKIWESRQIHS